MSSRWRPVAAAALVACAACGVAPLTRIGRRLVGVCGDAQGGYYADSYLRHECLQRTEHTNTERIRLMATDAQTRETTLAVRPHPEPDTAGIIARTDPKAILAWLGNGDLAGLKPEEIASVYRGTCESLGLNPLTRPFEIIATRPQEGQKGRLILYPTKGAAEQLRQRYRIDTRVVERVYEEALGLYRVTVRVASPDGRQTEQSGIVSVVNKDGLRYSGQYLADLLMRTETKAYRRATLAHVGLGGLGGWTRTASCRSRSTTRRARSARSAAGPAAPHPALPAALPAVVPADAPAPALPGAWVRRLHELVAAAGWHDRHLKNHLQKHYGGKTSLGELTPDEARALSAHLKATSARAQPTPAPARTEDPAGDAEAVEHYALALRGLVNVTRQAALAGVVVSPLLDDASYNEIEDFALATREALAARAPDRVARAQLAGRRR